jgi:hypothetical protein
MGAVTDEVVVRRAVARGAIDTFLDELPTGLRALRLVGPAGIGKTKHKREARDALGRAEEVFARHEMVPWARRASEDLCGSVVVPLDRSC